MKVAYEWQSTPLLPSKDAASLYSQWYKKAPVKNCLTAQARDWDLYCRTLYYSGTPIDCANAPAKEKANILRNLEKAKTTSQYACLYGG